MGAAALTSVATKQCGASGGVVRLVTNSLSMTLRIESIRRGTVTPLVV